MFPVPCLSLRRFVHNRSRRCLTVRQIVRTPQISLVPPIQLFLPLLSVPRIDHILLTLPIQLLLLPSLQLRFCSHWPYETYQNHAYHPVIRKSRNPYRHSVFQRHPFLYVQTLSLRLPAGQPSRFPFVYNRFCSDSDFAQSGSLPLFRHRTVRQLNGRHHQLPTRDLYLAETLHPQMPALCCLARDPPQFSMSRLRIYRLHLLHTRILQPYTRKTDTDYEGPLKAFSTFYVPLCSSPTFSACA